MTLIRDALPADIDAIEALEKECFSLPWPRNLIAANLSGENKIMLAAERDGELVGYMGMMYVPPEGYISNVCTAPRFRGMGAASALIAAMRERAKSLGLATLSLEVRESNAPARALYEKQGFQTLGKRPGYYMRPREDAVIMTLYLDNSR